MIEAMAALASTSTVDPAAGSAIFVRAVAGVAFPGPVSFCRTVIICIQLAAVMTIRSHDALYLTCTALYAQMPSRMISGPSGSS